MRWKFFLVTLLFHSSHYDFAQALKETCSRSLTSDSYGEFPYRGLGKSVDEISEAIFLSKNPVIKLFRNCISKQQQHDLMRLAKERLTDNTDSGFSSSLYLRNTNDSHLSILREITKLAGNLSGLPWKLSEPVSLTKYTLNQKYELHFDSGFAIAGGRMKRDATFLVYLNSVLRGGETIFPCCLNNSDAEFPCVPNGKPLLKDICHQEEFLKVSPQARTCLVFFNHEEQGGELHLRSLHGSCPVVNQEKWIVQIWLHREPWGSGISDFW